MNLVTLTLVFFALFIICDVLRHFCKRSVVSKPLEQPVLPPAERPKPPEDCKLIGPYDWPLLRHRLSHREVPPQTFKNHFFIPEEGSNLIRLLPSFLGSSPSFVQARQHYFPDQRPAKCSKKPHSHRGTIVWTGNCHHCSKNTPTERFYYNVLHKGKVKLFSVGKALQAKISAYNGCLQDPVFGHDIVLVKKTKNGYPTYEMTIMDPKPLGTIVETEQIMSSTFDLNKVVDAWG